MNGKSDEVIAGRNTEQLTPDNRYDLSFLIGKILSNRITFTGHPGSSISIESLTAY